MSMVKQERNCMKKLKRSELEEGLSSAIMSAAQVLEDLHVVYCKDDVATFLNIKIGNTTLAHLINNLYKIILPGITIAVKKLREFSKVFDWAAQVVQKLFLPA